MAADLRRGIISCQELQPWLLKRVERAPIAIEARLLELGLDQYARLVEVAEEGGELWLRASHEFPDELSDEGKRRVGGWVVDALIRSGCLEHPNLRDEVLPKLRIYDDVILAVDTNVILDCVLTSTFLRKGYICSPEVRQPNWVLVVIPKLVIAEVEDWANSKIRRDHLKDVKCLLSDEAWRAIKDRPHPWDGLPSYRGRVGQRGLQEILELDTNVDFRGLSIMTVGKLPDLYGTNSYRKEVRADSDIRAQVKEFIKSIDFHKGIFFLTQDRVNAMMACAEGIQGLYLQKPTWEQVGERPVARGELWRVVYELAVGFGQIRAVQGGEILFEASINWPAKHISEWERYCVKIL